MDKKIVGIIDDDQIYQFVTRKSIQNHSQVKEILQFYDGEQGINFFRENREAVDFLPHLILLDINMPFLNGWQFLDELKSLNINNYKPSIYIVSSSSSMADIAKAELYDNLSGYRVKPIDSEKFEKMLAEMNMN